MLSEDQRPLTVYDSSSELADFPGLVKNIGLSILAGRELAWRLFVRNLRGMYRQTLLGIFWIFLPPLANTAIWVFLKSRNVFSFDPVVATASSDVTFNFTTYILAGMVLWQAFIEAFLMPLESLNKNRSMFTKLNFPREALVLEGLAEVLFNSLIRTVVLIPVFWYFGADFHPASWLLAAGLGVLLVVFATGAGLVIAPLGALYHDVGRFLTLSTPFWMILTPIIYQLPASYPGTLLNWLNPASPLLVAARDLLVFGATGHWEAAAIYGAVALPLLAFGLIVWRVSIPALVERMTS